MVLVDTHCHLTDRRLAGQLPAVLERARQAGVVACISAASDLASSRAAAALAQAHAEVFFTAGVHPHEAQAVAPDYLAVLEALAAHPRCVAVGEIGLDFHYNFSPPEAQRRVFAGQLALARRLGKPVVVHTREAFQETLAILRDAGAAQGPLVLHSFTEGPEAAGAALDLGAAISFSGIVTFANAQGLREAARQVPAERLLVETDAPYLSPEPVRSIKTNEPAHVAHVLGRLAEVRGDDPDALARQTTANAVRLFGLPLAGA